MKEERVFHAVRIFSFFCKELEIFVSLFFPLPSLLFHSSQFYALFCICCI